MLGQNVRFAVRVLYKRPALTSVAVLTLALGIGANTAVFSVIRAVLLRPLDFPEPERLVKIVGLDTRTGELVNLSPADFLDFEDQNTVFDRTGAHGWIGFFTVTGGGPESERLGGVNVTEGFLPTLGVAPMLGRPFRPEEDRPGGPDVAILSHNLWQRRFGGRTDVIGTTMLVNARPTTIVGVLPAGFTHIEHNPERGADVFLPYKFDRAAPNRGGHFIRAIGRLEATATLAAARTELEAIASQLEWRYPDDNTNRSVRLDSLHEAMVTDARSALLILFGAVGILLLIACANVANLVLAGGTARHSEFAVRAALGASQRQPRFQMLTESLVLGVLGASAGLLIARWAMMFLTSLGAAGIPRAEEVRLDWFVLLFTLLAGCGTALLFGVLPAFHVTRADLRTALPGRGARPFNRGARDLLIATEVALSLVLLVAAGLFARSLWRLEHVDPGFAPERVLTMQAALPTATYKEREQIPFYERLVERIQTLPDVQAAGAINILPLTANYDSRGIQIEDSPQPPGQAPSVQARSVTPQYFRAMGIPLLRGRSFDARDRDDAPLVVLVSDSMARRYWPGQDPIGKRITFNSGIAPGRQQTVGGAGSREVVGVVGDVKHLELDEAEDTPFFYTPYSQQPSYHAMTLVVRTATDAAPLTSAIRAELAAMDSQVPLSQVRTIDAVLSAAVAPPRFRTVLIAIFAGLALLLSLAGVYGVVTFVVGERTREIGVRVALGARGGDVVRLIVAQAMAPVVWGTAAGLLAAAGVSRIIRSLLFGVTTYDPPTYLGVAALLLLAALVAALVPALRTTRIDPTQAMRAE